MGVRASAPLRRKRGSEAPSPSAEPPLELAIISDPGEDLDDELAMVYLRHLVALYPSLVVRCVVCNLRPARKRAALMRQTLDALNMKHVPVGVGDEVVPPSRARDDDCPGLGEDTVRRRFIGARRRLECLSAAFTRFAGRRLP